MAVLRGCYHMQIDSERQVKYTKQQTCLLHYGAQCVTHNTLTDWNDPVILANRSESYVQCPYLI